MELPDLLLIAVDVRSTHNVGAFFRTCDGFGAGLVLCGITPRPLQVNDPRLPHIAHKLHAAIKKTALGAEETVSWCFYETFADAVSMLRTNGYRIVALEQDAKSIFIQEANLKGKVALVVGREVDGLSAEELAACDVIAEIPMTGLKESFNVSVAAGIGLYEIACRNRSSVV